MSRYRLTVSYDGSAYFGWQIQPKHVTVQQKLQDAIRQVTGESVIVHGSGRTDQGVHARRQVAHLDLEKRVDPSDLRKALNAVMPADIRVMGIRRVAADFHARHSATGKEYRYFVWNAEVVPPFLRLYRTHVKDRLDSNEMHSAARQLTGRHDFAAFTANAKREVESTVRNLTELSVKRHGNEIAITARGDGFLYKMVRSIAGLLIRAGEGAVSTGEVRDILSSRIRTEAVPTAPPQGLFLWDVFYPAQRD